MQKFCYGNHKLKAKTLESEIKFLYHTKAYLFSNISGLRFVRCLKLLSFGDDIAAVKLISSQ